MAVDNAGTVEDILATVAQIVSIDSVQQHPKNPRRGNLPAIRESLRENGQFRPIIVQKSTNEILGGNHTWQAAKAEGWQHISAVFIDVDEKQAARIMLADNRTNDLASYDSDLLAEVMKGLDTPLGTGYSQDDYDNLLRAVEIQDVPAIEDVLRPPPSIPRLAEEGVEDDDGNIVVPPGMRKWEDPADAPTTEDAEDLDDVTSQLQGILALKEEIQFPSTNYYGIPDLNKNGLLDKLPANLDTWAGHDATPDDGTTTWLYNYGVAGFKGLPCDRAILCFFTYDTYFEGWWDNPAFYVAKLMNSGITRAVVPDFSFYTEMPTATHVYNTYRAQWMGRFFQEAGLKVIPRLQFGIGDGEKSLDFCMAGIPPKPPILAQSIQNVNYDDEFIQMVKSTRKCLEQIQPDNWLVYGGGPADKVIAAVKWPGKTTKLMNYVGKRRGIVFDKKEGLAGQKRAKKDSTNEEEPPPPQKRV